MWQRPSYKSLIINLLLINGQKPTALPSMTSCSVPKVFTLHQCGLNWTALAILLLIPLTTLVWTQLELRCHPSASVEAFPSSSAAAKPRSKCPKHDWNVSVRKSAKITQSLLVCCHCSHGAAPHAASFAASRCLFASPRARASPSASAWYASGPINLLCLCFCTPHFSEVFLPCQLLAWQQQKHRMKQKTKGKRGLLAASLSGVPTSNNLSTGCPLSL